MKITGSELRRLIREELASGAHGSTQLSPSEMGDTREMSPEEHSAADARMGIKHPESGVRDRTDFSGQYVDLRPLVDEMIGLGERAADLYKKSQGSLVPDSEWEDLQPQHRFSNAIAKALRSEILKMTRELQMEDEKPWEW